MNNIIIKKIFFVIFLAVCTTDRSTSAPLIGQNNGVRAFILSAIVVSSAVTLAAIHRMKHRSLKMNSRQDTDVSGWLAWIKVSLSSLWNWSTNKDARVVKLSQFLIDRLDQGEALADVMITKKHQNGPLGFEYAQFFYGYPEVAQRVISHANSIQINTPRQSLIDMGSYANCFGMLYAPALSLALQWDERDLVQALLSKGADPSQESVRGPKILKPLLDTNDILEFAVNFSNRISPAIVPKELINREAALPTGCTALHCAVFCNDPCLLTQMLSPHPKKHQALADLIPRICSPEEIEERPDNYPKELSYSNIANLILCFAEIPDVDQSTYNIVDRDDLDPRLERRQALIDSFRGLPSDIIDYHILPFLKEIPDEKMEKYINSRVKRDLLLYEWISVTPLHIAAEFASYETLAELLKYKPNPLLERKRRLPNNMIEIQTPIGALIQRLELNQPTIIQINEFIAGLSQEKRSQLSTRPEQLSRDLIAAQITCSSVDQTTHLTEDQKSLLECLSNYTVPAIENYLFPTLSS